MPAALQSPRSAARDGQIVQRTASLAFVLAVHCLLLLMLLSISGPLALPNSKRPTLITFNVAPDAKAAPERTRAREEVPSPADVVRSDAAPITSPSLPAPRALPADRPSIWSQVIPLTRREMAAGDVARFPARPAGTGEAGDRGDGGQEGADTSGPGSGPNGETLYNAQWYRKPTDAELSTYLPAGGAREGWGMIACRTVENYRVEDCVEIAQSPPGSGLSGALRQAAWQFRVLPPRIGGRKMVGAWVRIRIDYSIERQK